MVINLSSPFGLGVFTTLGIKVSAAMNISKLLIDSTCKTNSTKLEIFPIIGSIMGSGFPQAYFLLSPGREDYDISRKESICAFLLAFRVAFTDLNPAFFFTDKDMGQINSIRTVFGINVSICLWHMKRAIRRKLKFLCKEVGSDLSEKRKLFTPPSFKTLQFSSFLLSSTTGRTGRNGHGRIPLKKLLQRVCFYVVGETSQGPNTHCKDDNDGRSTLVTT